MEKTKLKKRKYCYVQKPAVYEIHACKCGNSDTEWSEFENKIWCQKCKKDFTPKHWGVFDGPLPVNASKLMGISLDRINLETNTIEKFNYETGTY